MNTQYFEANNIVVNLIRTYLLSLGRVGKHKRFKGFAVYAEGSMLGFAFSECNIRGRCYHTVRLDSDLDDLTGDDLIPTTRPTETIRNALTDLYYNVHGRTVIPVVVHVNPACVSTHPGRRSKG